MAWMLTVVLLGFPGATQAECVPVESDACVLTLHGKDAPAASASCSGEIWQDHLTFTQPERFSDLDGNGWHETVLKLDLEPSEGCTCMVFRVFFKESLRSPYPLDPNRRVYSVNIGNSATNDGFGGDAFTTRADAELQIVGERLLVFSAEASMEGPFPHDVMDLTLAGLGGRFLELEICDQKVRFQLEERPGDAGLSRGELTAHSTQTLFRLGTRPSKSPVAPAVQHSLYAGFNRVIHRIDGPPAKRRFGAAVRRVELFFRP